MKKFISIGLTALMMISALVVLDVVPIEVVNAELNPPRDDGLGLDPIPGDNIWNTDGDWEIQSGETRVHSNKTIIVNGNLIIWDSASLTLQNVTLLMNCPSNGTYRIIVKSIPPSGWGSLVIEDLDGDPLTTEDASNITSYTPDGKHRFGFVVEGINGAIMMRNSELHECGWNFSAFDYSDGGLRISQFATIENNEISDCYAGIILYYADNPTITGNYIHNCTNTGIFVVNTGSMVGLPETIGPNNTITNCYWGINVNSSTNIDIHNNTLVYNGIDDESGGLAVYDSNSIFIQDNIIDNNANYSLDVRHTNDIYVLRNSLNGSALTYFRPPIDGLEIRNNYICQGGKFPNVTYLIVGSYSSQIINAVLDNNVISNNNGIGVLIHYAQINITNNIIENNPGGGLGLFMGSDDSIIDNNIFRFNGDMGLLLVANNIEVTNNLFEGNGDGTPYANNPVFQDSGMSIINSDSIYISNNQFIQNVRTTGTEPVNGIYLLGSTNIMMENNIMDRNNNNLYCRGDSTALDANSTYTWLGLINNYDVYLEDAWAADLEPGPYGPNHMTFLNVSFNKSWVNIEDSISGDLTVQWYKHLIVQNNSGNPVSGVTIYINDSNGDPEPSSGQPFTTDAQGRVTFIPLTEYVENNAGRIYYTPHDIEACEGGREASDTANMANSHYNTLMLNERPVVIDIWPAEGIIPTNVYRTNMIEIHANGSDAEDSEDMLTPYFQYRVNDTSPWISDTDPGNYFVGPYQWEPIGGFFKIVFQPPADANLGLYDFRVRFEDTYPTSSDWLNSSNSVNVLNNHPDAEDLLESGPTVYRGNNFTIFADASDIEGIDEDSTWDAELEYRLNGSSSWESVYITVNDYDSFSGHWKFEFTPPNSSPDPRHGPVDFRVRFQDPDGNWSNWYYEYDLINILNNPPLFEDFGKDADSVYRGDTVRVYVNVSDAEESEQDLYVHFYYYNGTNWVEDWLSTPNIGSGGRGEWDGVQQRFFVDFSPPSTANIGNYQFRLYISDSDGGYLTYTPGGFIIEVMNNPPIALYPVSVSAPYVRPGGGYVYIYVNADDGLETPEDQLTLRVQQRYNESGNPPNVWYDTYVFTETYEGTPPSGRWRANFTPLSGVQLGWYDFRAWVVDEEGDESNYVYLFHAVEVLNPEPTIEDIALGMTEVYRDETLYIFLNASDLSDDESELTPEIQYLPEDGSWTDIPSSAMSYSATARCWVIEFIPPCDVKTGTYFFKARVKNTAQLYSDGGDWETGLIWTTGNIVEVKNNPPIASNLRVEGDNIVERGDTIYLYADVTDVEYDPDELIPHFEYRVGNGSWEDEYLGNLRAPTGGSNSWRITFSPDEDETFTLGLYDFRVWFEDDEDNSNIVTEEDLVNVLNVAPSVDAINVEQSEGYRLEPIYITADGSDAESDEARLTPTFEYSGNGVNWIGVEDSGSYFQDTPTYINGKWYITFNPPADAELGKYSFRVKFSDGIDESNWMNKDDSYEVRNNEPEVEITSPLPGIQSSDEVYFTATAADYEDSTLTWEWNFGDGDISTEESPTHTYEKAGNYRVTVKVTDSDGDDDMHYIDIKIEEAEEEPTELDMNMVSLLLILLLIVIILLLVFIILLLLTMRKIRPPGAPPEEITSWERPQEEMPPEEAPPEPPETVETPPPPPEEVPESPIKEEAQDEISPSLEPDETQKSEPQDEIEK